jgi:hypothetical protein
MAELCANYPKTQAFYDTFFEIFIYKKLWLIDLPLGTVAGTRYCADLSRMLRAMGAKVPEGAPPRGTGVGNGRTPRHSEWHAREPETLAA